MITSNWLLCSLTRLYAALLAESSSELQIHILANNVTAYSNRYKGWYLTLHVSCLGCQDIFVRTSSDWNDSWPGTRLRAHDGWIGGWRFLSPAQSGCRTQPASYPPSPPLHPCTRRRATSAWSLTLLREIEMCLTTSLISKLIWHPWWMNEVWNGVH